MCLGGDGYHKFPIALIIIDTYNSSAIHSGGMEGRVCLAMIDKLSGTSQATQNLTRRSA
jgi:hypothetical protein